MAVKRDKPELLAPAGDMERLKMAVLYGADAVYLAGKEFGMRGGVPNCNGMGGPGYSIRGEFSHNGVQNSLKHDRGVLSMARAMNPNSAGSQFFIMVEKAPHLDGEYAAFGKVIEGMDVADTIVNADRDRMDKPKQEQRMKSVTVETFGVDYPAPAKC